VRKTPASSALYEYFTDGAFSKAENRGDGIGSTRVGKAIKIMILVDVRGADGRLQRPDQPRIKAISIQQLFAFIILQTTPARVIGDKAYDSDCLDEFLAAQGFEMIAHFTPNPQVVDHQVERWFPNSARSTSSEAIITRSSNSKKASKPLLKIITPRQTFPQGQVRRPDPRLCRQICSIHNFTRNQ
jgi:hypothetical protein